MKNERKTLKDHWDKVYLKTPDEKSGWYETDLGPTLKLVSETELPTSAIILNVGAGNTLLIDELLRIGYSNLIATDISGTALKKLENRIGIDSIRYITDDLTNPTILRDIDPVDLWIDRAVLHFFTEENDQITYFDLLKRKVKRNGYALIAEFSLSGATVCSGLPIYRYSKELLNEKVGSDFELIYSFDYIYLNPSGGERPYIYTLFKKKD